MPALRTRDTPSQSLEVITGTLQPPTLAIISPTPRAFNFPFNQNDDTPSPSNSPFEPDLRKLTLTPSQPTSIVRTDSPVSPGSASSSSSSSTSVFSTTPSSLTTSSAISFPNSSLHKRRKSSVCSDIERRPKKGDEDYVKRPENAFILFRRKCCETRQLAQEEAAASADGPTKKQRQADLSKTISQQWKALSPEERLYWEELAKEKKKEHEQMYPNYVYRPQRSKDKRGKKGKRGEFEHETDSENTISFVLPFSMPTTAKHGRSVSAPTPPPARQTIQIPSVYMPSCPTSPSIVPMISRRSSHPDHGTSSSSQFDFIRANTALPQQHQDCRSDMFPVDVNGFYHGMFDNSSAPHPLMIPSDMSMQMVSPASSIASDSSGPSSPDAGPFTPTTSCLHTDFSYSSCIPESQMEGAPALSQAGSLDNVQFNYSQFSSWESPGAWGDQNDLLVGDEFDMSAIPPIELGIPGCGSADSLTPTPHTSSFDVAYTPGPAYDATSQYSPESQSPEMFEQLFNFDGMLPVQHGY
ncbi:hypothetical protein V8B97DRAFT_1296964 [Scleroderma yunnanense]